MRYAGLVLAFCLTLSAQPAAFEGLAVHSSTRQPLSGVHIRLMGLDFEGAGEMIYGAMSDRAGHFSITGVKPGAYVLMPEYRGFVYTQKKQGMLPFPSVTLKSGEQMTEFRLEMTPSAAIVGRVVDEYGDPIQGAAVEAEPVSADTVVASAGMSERLLATSDDRGMFRISGAPGKYYVKARTFSGKGDGPPEIRTDGTLPAEFALTYYPSAASKEESAVVKATAGGEVTGIEIRRARLVRVQTVKISGLVTGIPAGDSSATVILESTDGRGRMTESDSTSTAKDGKFRFSRVEPGSYRISATYQEGSTQLQSPLFPITVARDETIVDLRLASLGDVVGTIEVPGEPAGRTAKRTVRLEGGGPFGSPKGEVEPDGTFRITGVPHGIFKAHVDPLPENAYVKDVQSGGPGVVAGSRIRITVSLKGAQISGEVLNTDGDKLPNTFAAVFLIDDPEKEDFHGSPDHFAQVIEGKYTFKSIRPGKYRIVAIDALHSPDFTKPEVAKKLSAAAEEFEVKEDDRIIRDVRVVEQEEPHAK